MLVSILAEPGLFRDLLVNSLVSAGNTIGLIAETPGELSGSDIKGCLVVHASETSDAFCNAIRTIHRKYPKLPVVIVCPKPLEAALVEKLGVDVNGVISEDKPLELVLNAIVVASEGFAVIDLRNIQSLNGSIFDLAQRSHTMVNEPKRLADPDAKPNGLTNREGFILQRIHDGQSNKEIARDLEISDSTVKAHMRSIFRKIGVKNRTQAAVWVSDHLL